MLARLGQWSEEIWLCQREAVRSELESCASVMPIEAILADIARAKRPEDLTTTQIAGSSFRSVLLSTFCAF